MHKIFLICLMLFQINLFAQDELPSWVTVDPDKKGVYFRGISTWYVSDDARTRGLSRKDALRDAYSSVSEYFGLNISYRAKQIVSETHKSFKSTTKTKTNQLIFDLKPIKNFIEYSEDRENYREYVLILLNKKVENKIKKEMRKDKEEFKALKAQVLELIKEKNYFEAKNTLELAKGKRSAFMDDTVDTLEKRLQILIDGRLVSKLTVSKKIYKPDEEIELEASINQDGYLYLFYVTGTDVEMLYPNKYRRSPYLKKERMIQFPNEDIESLLAYEEDLNQKVQFYAVASKKNLSLKQYAKESVDGIYIYNKNGKYIEIIKNCIHDGLCMKTTVNFRISNTVSANMASVTFIANSNIKQSLIKYFRKKGIRTKVSHKQIIFKIKKESRYSRSLEQRIVSYNIHASLHRGSKRIKVINESCDENALADSLYEMYQELEDL